MMSEGMTKSVRNFVPNNLRTIYEGCRDGISGALIRNPPDSVPAPTKDTKAKDQDGAVSSLTEKLKGSHISSGKGS